ncbi:MAG: hypothetical protein K6E40_09840 [Desulfovibrio sp.]|nr:hypothetical protein [Desulfovibrio sp.]
MSAMLSGMPSDRAVTPSKACGLAVWLMGGEARFVTETDFLMVGGAVASCFCGPLRALREKTREEAPSV